MRIIYTNKMLLIESYLANGSLPNAKRVAKSITRRRDHKQMLTDRELSLIDKITKARRIEDIMSN